ncbi:MAG: L,D-transpeptidase [Xanthobacteraceae bacterium]|jgi:lipoprotein-anchoring transpeptidase ErfK/SrfK
MRRAIVASALMVALSCMAGRADANIIVADVVVQVDKATQRMSVSVDGNTQYTWAVSTAAGGYVTPDGIYRPIMMARMWYSRKYHMSPMPHSIFFHEGWAIHGSFATGALGSPASHGCVRLHPRNAATLYALVEQRGRDNTAIIVTSSAPRTRAVADHPKRKRPATRPLVSGL